jgi:hypothetical protein
MSASDKKHSHPQTWELTGSWAGAWKVFAGIGVVGLGLAGVGYTTDPHRFAFSWLFGFMTVLTVALGALFFVLVQRSTAAGWSVTVRRTAEFFALGLVVMVPLFAPVLFCMNMLFPWLGHHAAAEEHASISLVTPAYAQDHAPTETAHAPAPGSAAEPAAPAAPKRTFHPTGAGNTNINEHGDHSEHAAPPGMPEPKEKMEEQTLERKAGYLNRNFFLARAAIYFLIWILLSTKLFNYSVDQDRSKDPQLTVRAQRFSLPALHLFGFSLTFAAFDWVMSLEPSWFSTIFGVVIFACGTVSSYALIILVTLSLKNAGPLEGAVNSEHYHDLGKLMWGFLIFWAYVSFAQFMLIWYAALPEETTFFHNRWDWAPWNNVTVAIILGHFVIPFFWLISRNFKRNLGRLQIGSFIILVMHVIDMYWFVMPNFHLGKAGFTFHWMDLACLFACIGVYGAFVFHRMTKHPLVPIGDPRLERSLHFQNA